MRALFLAQSPSPISLDWQAGLIALLLFILLVLNIWDKLKRKPALEEVFATRIDLKDLKDDLTQLGALVSREIRLLEALVERRITEIRIEADRKIEALDRRRETGETMICQLVNDKVGQMEKYITQQIIDNREGNQERFGEMSGKISALTGSFQGLSNDLMHQVGRLEGQMLKEQKQ